MLQFDKMILPASLGASRWEINPFSIFTLFGVRAEPLRFLSLSAVTVSVLILMEAAKQNYLQRAIT